MNPSADRGYNTAGTFTRGGSGENECRTGVWPNGYIFDATFIKLQKRI